MQFHMPIYCKFAPEWPNWHPKATGHLKFVLQASFLYNSDFLVFMHPVCLNAWQHGARLRFLESCMVSYMVQMKLVNTRNSHHSINSILTNNNIWTIFWDFKNQNYRCVLPTAKLKILVDHNTLTTSSISVAHALAKITILYCYFNNNNNLSI